MKHSRSLAFIRGWFFAGEAGFFKLPLILNFLAAPSALVFSGTPW
jgi:hypothetical protein